MGLYGDEYFVDNLSLLEDAFNDEFKNFNALIEQVDVQPVTEGLGISVLNGFLNLWERFYEWFTKLTKDIRISFKKSQINSLIGNAKKHINGNYTYNGITYKYHLVNDIDEVDAKEYYEAMKDIISDLKEIDIYDYDDISDQLIDKVDVPDKIKELKIVKDEDYDYKRSSDGVVYDHWKYSDDVHRHAIFDTVLEFKELFDYTINIHDKLYKIINDYNIECRRLKQEILKSKNIAEEIISDESIKFGSLKILVTALKSMANENFALMGRTSKIISVYCYGLMGKTTKDYV
jgi:hypothetical protein